MRMELTPKIVPTLNCPVCGKALPDKGDRADGDDVIDVGIAISGPNNPDIDRHKHLCPRCGQEGYQQPKTVNVGVFNTGEHDLLGMLARGIDPEQAQPVVREFNLARDRWEEKTIFASETSLNVDEDYPVKE